MKKLLAFLVVPMLLLTACGGPAPDETPDDGAKLYAFNITFIGSPDFHGWFDYLDENSQEAQSKYTFHKVDSVFDQTQLVKELAEQKETGFINAIWIGFGPDDYVGGTIEAAEADVEAKKAYIDELSEITLSKDVVLMVGNGFPKLEEESDEHLVWNLVEMTKYVGDKLESSNDMIVNFAVLRALSSNYDYLNPDYINEDGSLNDLALKQLGSDLGMYLALLSKRKSD